jgi:sugar lactone lactonase YvrE
MCPVHLVWNVGSLLGESPVWSHEDSSLYFIDIKGKQLNRWNHHRGGVSFPLKFETGSIVPCSNGVFLAAQSGGLAIIETDPWREVRVGPRIEEPNNNRFNDGKCDMYGRYWFASMDNDCSLASGTVWSFSPNGMLRRHFGGFIVGNGFGWSLDGSTMYFTDSENRCIQAFPYDLKAGVLGTGDCFARIDPSKGYPDGLAVDDEDHVWSAHWDGGRISRYRPDGTIERVIPLPVPRPTSLAFGGPDRSTLFVTSARIGLSCAQLRNAPLSGGLFSIEAGISGPLPSIFRGSLSQ